MLNQCGTEPFCFPNASDDLVEGKLPKRSGADLYIPLSRVMLRCPSLPIQALDSRTGIKTESDFTDDADFSLALLTASPSLHARRASMLERAETDIRLARKLRRFLTRMSTRPTPFGLLAGVAFLKWGCETDVVISDNSRTRTRMDMDWIVDHVRTLEYDTDICNNIRWTSHSAVWQHGGRAILSRGGDSASAASVACTAPVRLILEKARHPMLYQEIRDCVLANIASATVEKFQKVFSELQHLGFLFSELMPPITGVRDPLLWVIDHLPDNVAGNRERVLLVQLMSAINQCDVGTAVDRTHAFRKAGTLAEKTRAHQRPLPFQIDLLLGTKGEVLNQAVAREAARAAQLLIEISGASVSSTPAVRYYAAFVSRYGAEREVPFLEVAHPEWGLGLTPLRLGSTGTGYYTQYYNREHALHCLMQRSLRERRITVELDEETINILRVGAEGIEHWPTSIDLNVFLLADSPSSIDTGNFTLCLGPNVGAMKAGHHFARFGDLSEDAVLAVLNESLCCERERAPFRELVQLTFLPMQTRLANVALRPALPQREANVGVSASVQSTDSIRLDDLMVGTEGGRLYVRCSGSSKKLAFASDCMLNPAMAPREIQVLLAITSDPIAPLTSFPWGTLTSAAFLPRVIWRKTILQCAQWNLRGQPKSSTEDFHHWLRGWRGQWMCPQYVYLCSGDNRLLLDLEDELQIGELKTTLVKEGGVVLQEAVPHAKDAWLPSHRGSHITELVIPLRLKNIKSKPAAETLTAGQRSLSTQLRLDRFKPPGSDWVFLKLYGPQAGENEIISGALREFCSGLSSEVKWHFVRYADPRRHLRIRFQSKTSDFDVRMIMELSRWATGLLARERCEGFSFDIYEREIERYGGPSVISAVEAIFCVDSGLAAGLIAGGLPSDAIIPKVFIFDRLLEMFGFIGDSRLSWLKQFVNLTAAEAVIHREHRTQIVEALVGTPQGPLKHASDWLNAHSHLFADVSEAIDNASSSGALTQSRAEICRSIIHMHCNRLWGTDSEKELEALRLLRRAREQISHLNL